jgi:hypothetical protein
MEDHGMAGITEKSGATDHRSKNTALAFDAQILFDA